MNGILGEFLVQVNVYQLEDVKMRVAGCWSQTIEAAKIRYQVPTSSPPNHSSPSDRQPIVAGDYFGSFTAIPLISSAASSSVG